MTDSDPTDAQGRSEQGVIERLYDVAVDPTRYEELLDQWEALIAPQRLAANLSASPTLGLDQLAGHVQRADLVLDRVILSGEADTPAALLARIDRNAAFAVDGTMTAVAVNTAAASVLGITQGGRVADLALAEGEAAELVRQIDGLLRSNRAIPAVLRSRSARTDRIIVFTLRVVRPETAAPFVLAISSELTWPAGFSEMLRNAFDLTQAEAEVMQALAEGQPLVQIAEQRGRSVETVRAQLKSLMSKTETRSQAELVRLTLSTMEMALFSDAAAEEAPESSIGMGRLEPRPFQTITRPDGRRLDYLVLGDPEGRPCLFLPLDYGLVRWPASAEAEAERRGIKVIVPVRPGYGASTSLPRGLPYIETIVDDITALLDHHGLADQPVPCISLGGDSYIAFRMNASHPGRLKALICCAGVLPFTRPIQYERMDKWHRFILAGARYTPHLLPFMVKAGFALARRLGKRGFVHAVYGKSRADVATFEIDEVYEAMVCGSDVSLSETHSAHDAFAREVIAHETGDWSTEVEILRQGPPVHFLNGLQDPQVPPGTLEEFRQDHPWIDFRVYPDAGQLLFFLKWRDVLGLLETYLEPSKSKVEKPS